MVAALCAAFAPTSRGQGTPAKGILFRFGGDAYRALRPGDDYTLPLMVDASLTTNSATNVASLSGVTYWPSCLSVTSITSGSIGLVNFGPLDAFAGGFRQELSIRATNGVKDGAVVAVYRFHALEECNGGAAAFGRVEFHATVLGNSAGASVLDRVAGGNTVQWPSYTQMHAAAAYCIGWQGTIGQVRGLPITALDAEQVARFTVSLPVFSDARVTLYGDVNDDGEANIIDAQQLARFVAGLGAASNINHAGVDQCAAQLATDTAEQIQTWPSVVAVQAGNSVAIDGLLQASRLGFSADYPTTATDDIEWTSTDPGVATVTNKGVVRGVSEGTAYISAHVARGSVDGVVTVSVLAPATATQPTSVNLKVVGSSTGSGAVTSDAGGLACTITGGVGSGACTVGYRARSIVTLTATPNGNARFSGWSGDCSGTQPQCTIEMAAVRNVTAAFAPLSGQNRLTVVAEGAGDGSVAGDAGISCTSTGGAETGTCSANIAVSSTVSLTANAIGGSSFAGWSGDCAGSGACVVAMSQAHSVTATFARDASSGPQLTVAIRSAVAPVAAASGSVGTVIGQDQTAQTCSASVNSSCSYSEPSGSLVTLKATPGYNYAAGVNHAFMEWRGACSGSQPTCSLQMTSDRSVEAVFRQTVALEVAPSAVALFGRVDVNRTTRPDTSCTESCVVADLFPSTYVVTPVPATGWRFRCWLALNSSLCEDTSATVQRSPTARDRVTPRFYRPITPAAIAAGKVGACAVSITGGLYCWGKQTYYTNWSQDESLPVMVPSPEALTQISVGATHACGVAASRAAYCWGLNLSAQLGDSSQTPRGYLSPALVKFDKGFTKIVAGSDFSCGLVATGYAYCWGSNSVGQVSLGASCGSLCTGPTKVSDTYKFIDIAAGSSHVCGVTTANAMVCWGENAYGGVGVSTATCTSCGPQVVTGSNTFTAVAAGEQFSCGLTTSGGVLCWGLNSSGQLGTGATSGVANPTPTAIVSPAGPFDNVTAAGSSACARLASGRVGYCWGGVGQVNGFTATPTAIASSAPTSMLSAGTFFACFKKPSNGDLLCLGDNTNHQIGVGSFLSTPYVAEPWVVERSDP
jgi:alpha-tubulin suppressor-like RCC1 family protein